MRGRRVGSFANAFQLFTLLLVILDALQGLLGNIYLTFFGSDERLFRCQRLAWLVGLEFVKAHTLFMPEIGRLIELPIFVGINSFSQIGFSLVFVFS